MLSCLFTGYETLSICVKVVYMHVLHEIPAKAHSYLLSQTHVCDREIIRSCSSYIQVFVLHDVINMLYDKIQPLASGCFS